MNWISCDTKLPPACHEVLACNAHHLGRRMPFLYYVGTHPSECRADITHWMHLPTVPDAPSAASHADTLEVQPKEKS